MKVRKPTETERKLTLRKGEKEVNFFKLKENDEVASQKSSIIPYSIFFRRLMIHFLNSVDSKSHFFLNDDR